MDTPLQIAVIISSVRDDRMGESIGAWAADQLPHEVEATVLDLRTIDLPDDALLRPGGSGVTAASDLIDASDGFVIVTPEYNHAYPASLKRFIDWHYREWQFKAATVLPYGSQTGGAYAGEALRGVFAELSVVTTRRMVTLRSPWDHLTADGAYSPADETAGAYAGAVGELLWWSDVLVQARRTRPMP